MPCGYVLVQWSREAMELPWHQFYVSTRYNMKKYIVLILAVFICVTADASEQGLVWCNTRYLDKQDRPFDEKHLQVASRGYMYAVAGALILQRDDEEGKAHHFSMPGRMVEADRPPRDQSGFEVATYELYTTPSREDLKEIIIAFSGANDKSDWVNTNFGFSKEQFKLAREYVTRIANTGRYKGIPLVVTGYSLGGGLAVHVTRHPDTSAYITEAWALNPSPKTYANGDIDKRIWLAAVDYEALRVLRTGIFRALPGVEKIGVPESQTADRYYLISTNPINAHFRWVLARNMLHVADLALMDKNNPDKGTEPLEILSQSSFSACGGNIP